MTNVTTATAAARYEACTKRIDAAMAEIESLMSLHAEAFADAGSASYGFVGEVAEVADLLETAVAFLMGDDRE